MPRIQLPDRPELTFSIEDVLRAEFSSVGFCVGKTSDEPVDLVLDVDPSVPPTPETVSLKLYGAWQDPVTYRLPAQWHQLKDDLRRRLDGLASRHLEAHRPLAAQSSSELPALGDELFTLGGIPVPHDPVPIEPNEAVADFDDAPAQNTHEPLPEPFTEHPLPDDLFSLGTSELRRRGKSAGVQGEQVTAPGILRRNTFDAPVESHESPQPLAGLASQSFDGPFDGNLVQHFLGLHHQGFSGVLELALPQFTMRMSWEGGRVGDLEGYAPILQHLLQLTGAGSSFSGDLTRTLSDPIDWAVRRQLISPDEETKWLLRCRREAIRLAITAKRAPLPVDNVDFRRHLPLLDPRPLLFCGVVEHFGSDMACALCDCEPPTTAPLQWNPLFDDPDFDPLWVRALHLLGNGTPWEEACIRAGLSKAELWTLGYACRLFQLCGPPLPATIPGAEILRRRFRTLEENLRTQSPDQFFGASAPSARRVHQGIIVQMSEFPVPLRILLAGDFEKLKKSMDKAMSLLSL